MPRTADRASAPTQTLTVFTRYLPCQTIAFLPLPSKDPDRGVQVACFSGEHSDQSVRRGVVPGSQTAGSAVPESGKKSCWLATLLVGGMPAKGETIWLSAGSRWGD